MELRTGSIFPVRYGSMVRPSWRAQVTVDGRQYSRQSADRAVCEEWLNGMLDRHPVFRRGHRPGQWPEWRDPDYVKVMKACLTLRRRWRPDLVHELIHGWDPRDIAKGLGWDAKRTRKALDRCVEKELLDMHCTPVGKGEARRMERLYTPFRPRPQFGGAIHKGMYNTVI